MLTKVWIMIRCSRGVNSFMTGSLLCGAEAS